MEAPIELLWYMSLVGVLFVIVKGYMGIHRVTKSLSYESAWTTVREYRAGAATGFVALPSRPLFLPQRRKIPIRERTNRTDEDGRPFS
ncbi:MULTISPECIES: hypothetical protein [Geobacillus]|jgi:hypothetical protein|uniref:Uncharacterized protein n=2 Tax=Geobacillus thermodenitrificans TaxID=33940 RepID=A4IP18_GEOTN|nr:MULTISPECIES: hypothetical protein [Geobacillus]ABO67072.1 Conserved hypothetical protein [Geobacillus thermodenitrificans NG80-2]ARA96629.1 hypothetical protein GD3902_00325 [Geobacillus thermodenitrificans]ARP42827.1 hypothetical protein GTHT12_01287 [Geobacillus thermodenitrificans]ATO35897.1 hypothetical protein GTID1_00885 [Geobacillus thermodenitrificans]KQB93265.1 hypothetical protein GEPA3_1757 [Geobacillus sp. PA-3]